MRLKLVSENTNFDFFSRWKLWLGLSALMMMVGFGSYLYQGLNFGTISVVVQLFVQKVQNQLISVHIVLRSKLWA